MENFTIQGIKTIISRPPDNEGMNKVTMEIIKEHFPNWYSADNREKVHFLINVCNRINKEMEHFFEGNIFPSASIEQITEKIGKCRFFETVCNVIIEKELNSAK